MTRLILRFPNNVIKEVEFDQPKYRVGSAEDNDLVIEQEGVSPHQAEIEQAAGNFSIVDVSEDKSTTVNGKPFERSNLNYGDRIAFGPVSGLFYPVKKSKIGDKAKLFLYMGAGALIIVLSIVFIFYMTSRQISSAVTERLGDGIITDEVTDEISYVTEAPETEAATAKEKRRISLPALEREFPGFQRPERIKLVLPEPDSQSIETRMAVAVPRGIGRVFFRKIPVVVQGEKIESIVSDEIEFEEGIDLEEGEKKGGIFQKVLSPVNRLLRAEREQVPEDLEEFAFEEEIEPEEFFGVTVDEDEAVSAGERFVEVVAMEDINRVVDPLSVLSTRDIPEASEVIFKEEPLYGEEVGEPAGETVLEETFLSADLSQIESINFDLIWKYPEGLEKLGPIVRAGTVLKFVQKGSYGYLFGTKEGALVAVDGKSGEEIFSEEMGNSFYDPIAVYLDRGKLKNIVVTFENGNIAVYTVNLERLWLYNGIDPITSIPLVIDVNSDKVPDIIFTTFNMDVIAIDGTTGFELWRFFDAESEVIHSPVAIDVNGDSVLDVVLCTKMGRIYVLDGKTGWSLWKREIFGIPAGPPTVADLDGDESDEIVTLTKNGLLSTYSKDGKLLFTFDTESKFNIAPSVGDLDRDKQNEIVIIDTDGVLRALEGKTRREEWIFETEEGGVFGRIALTDVDFDGGLDVIVCTFSGALFILDGDSGAQIAQYNLGSHCLATPIIADINRDGISEVIVGSYAGELFTLKVSDIKKKLLSFRRSFWISSNHDYRNTGASQSYFIKNPWK
ncbi:MAG: PQQ-binding-like beta-propeller repeat protein [Spirochaetota bacterium]|nr:MAG: PQQ-binding-like beta-propeller repeat protein [Spirochaetota bacterium]